MVNRRSLRARGFVSRSQDRSVSGPEPVTGDRIVTEDWSQIPGDAHLIHRLERVMRGGSVERIHAANEGPTFAVARAPQLRRLLLRSFVAAADPPSLVARSPANEQGCCGRPGPQFGAERASRQAAPRPLRGGSINDAAELSSVRRRELEQGAGRLLVNQLLSVAAAEPIEQQPSSGATPRRHGAQRPDSTLVPNLEPK